MQHASLPAVPSGLPRQVDVDPGRPAAASVHLKHVDGLRAVAVAAVVLYHAGVPFLGGGFVGVDVFFVISGYLITGLLLRELSDTGRLDLLRFYARRARRLLPAASLVVLSVAAAGVVLLPSLARRELAVDVAAATLFVANWRYVVAATEYSAPAAEQSPLLHFWSLAVEEQFYLLWPLLMLLAVLGPRALTRARRSRASSARVPVLAALLVVTAVSFALSVTRTPVAGTEAYFGLHTRAWELGVGGLLAVLQPWLLQRLGRPAGTALVAVGTVAVVWSCVRYSEATVFPGAAALLPVLGTAAVLLGGMRGGGPLQRALEGVPARVLGLLSYSLYLWHWPVLFFAAQLVGDREARVDGSLWGLSVVETAAALLLALALSALSYRLVETPLRFAAPLVRSRAASLSLGAALIAAGLVAAGLLWQARGAAETVTVDARPAAMTVAEAAEDRMDYRGCHLPQRGEPTFEDACTWGDPDGQVRVLLVGDSHAAHWLPTLEVLGRENGWTVELRSKSACNPVDVVPWLSAEDRVYTECAEWREGLFEHVVEEGPYDLVLVGRSRGQLREVAVEGRPVSEEQALEGWGEAAARTVSRLLEGAHRVVVLGDNPAPGYSVPDCLAENDGDSDACTFSTARRTEDDRRMRAAEEAALAGVADALVVDTTGLVCQSATCTTVTSDGVVKFRDAHHLTATFARSLAPGLEVAIGPVPR